MQMYDMQLDHDPDIAQFGIILLIAQFSKIDLIASFGKIVLIAQFDTCI